MVKNHQKSTAAPKTWTHDRKKNVFVTRSLPGAHTKMDSMPLSVLLKDTLKFAKTTKEVKDILNNKVVLVDQKRRKDYKFAVGFTDTISFPEIKKSYRITINQKGKLGVKEITEEESKTKPCKVLDKKNIGKNNVQLKLSGGRIMIVDEKKSPKTQDTIVIELPGQKIKNEIKLEKGAIIFLTSGKHIGKTGTVESIENNNIRFKSDDNEYTTKKKYAFVIGKTKGEVTI